MSDLSATASPRDILARLVAFDTVSSKPNLPLIEWVAQWLAQSGIEAVIVPGPEAGKAGLYAHVGAIQDGGVLLSGHTDVVPAEGQAWATDPFVLTERDGRLFGRGTCDMKGFVALALWAMADAARGGLVRPLQIALTWDEEVGCLGAPDLILAMQAAGFPKASAAIIGEPSQMQVVTGHKGNLGYQIHARGYEVHSSLMHTGVSAVMESARVINWAHARNRENAQHTPSGTAGLFEPPWTTLHCGVIRGGTAENITALDCDFGFDFRFVPGDDIPGWKRRLQDEIDRIGAEMAAVRPGTGFEMTQVFWVPPLEPEPGGGAAEALARRLTGDNGTHVVAYATEGGQFQEAGYSAVICGPGNIAQAHQPDEYLSLDQLDKGWCFMRTLLDELRA